MDEVLSPACLRGLLRTSANVTSSFDSGRDNRSEEPMQELGIWISDALFSCSLAKGSDHSSFFSNT